MLSHFVYTCQATPLQISQCMLILIVFIMQVSTNGLVSFEGFFDLPNACPFPCADVPVIAPIWINLNFENNGLLYYRVSHDTATLNQVVDRIAQVNPGLHDYQPTLAVIVTWFEASPVFAPVSILWTTKNIRSYNVV